METMSLVEIMNLAVIIVIGIKVLLMVFTGLRWVFIRTAIGWYADLSDEEKKQYSDKLYEYDKHSR